MKCFLGFDGGGTKTECVVLNDAGAIVARGRGPASNPTRIGIPAALAALQQTCEAVLSSARISLEVAALCAGLAGTARAEFREPILQFLKEKFPTALVDVRTDLEASLDAMPQGPAIVLVVGTGSAAIGRNDAGTVQREGGFGPATSDEGSAYDIGRAAVSAVRDQNSSEAADELSRQILRHLGCSNWSEVDARAAANADAIYPRVFPVVAAAADAGNLLAQSLLRAAAEKLAELVHRLVDSLQLAGANLPLGKTGGTVGRSRFFDQAVDQELRRIISQVKITTLSVEPSEVAAWTALQAFQSRKGAAK
jgi:N-acetylglucosamine kinase-like BadF-type ATPase